MPSLECAFVSCIRSVHECRALGARTHAPRKNIISMAAITSMPIIFSCSRSGLTTLASDEPGVGVGGPTRCCHLSRTCRRSSGSDSFPTNRRAHVEPIAGYGHGAAGAAFPSPSRLCPRYASSYLTVIPGGFRGARRAQAERAARLDGLGKSAARIPVGAYGAAQISCGSSRRRAVVSSGTLSAIRWR